MTLFFGYSSLTLFTIDIWIKFNTAIYKLGIIKTDKLEIIKHYFKNSFSLDFIANMGIWLSLVTENN